MNQRGDLINRIAKAASLTEQAALVAELDAFDRGNTAAVAASRSLDFTASIVDHTLGAATAHERSTTATDWLGEISTTASADASQQITATAAMWYRRLSDEVKADDHEFGEQAHGMARREASAYGEQANGLAQEFLQYVSFLRSREGASGLPQVQQEVDSFENSAPTPLNQEVFDNFAPEVHPINQGVSGTETSERAPLLQEIEAEGNGGGTETHHDTAPAVTWDGITPTSSLFEPTVAMGYVMNLDDFKRQASACGCPNGSDGEHAGDCPGYGGGTSLKEREEDDPYGDHYASRHEAASGLDQVQQTVDSFENPDPKALDTEVAYPWILSEDEQAEKDGQKAASLDPEAIKRRAAYVAGLTMKDPATLSDGEKREIISFSASLTKRADEWTQGGEQYKGPSAQNSPFTTPEPSTGTAAQGYAEGQADRANDQAPTYADASPSVPPAVQGYSEGYAQGDAPVVKGQMPPGAGGFGNGYETHAASLQTAAALEVEAANLTCATCGKQDTRGNMTQRGNGHTVDSYCKDCVKTPTDPNKVRWQGSLQTSAAFTAPVDTADPEFAKAYKYASKWAPGKRLVTQGSAAFEAGLYAGITDNPEHQAAWTTEHRRVASAHKKPEMLQRISKHRAFTKKAVRSLPDLRVVDGYLQTRVPAKTAATSTDLDTMLPSASPSPTGSTPINGPGTPPPLQGGSDPAAAGGPSPYNGAEPFGQPVVPNSTSIHGTPTAIDDTPGGPVDRAAQQHIGPAALAFRRTVQANLLSSQKGN